MNSLRPMINDYHLFLKNGAGNLALGAMEDANFKETTREIVPGQIIVIAIDGI
jgi:serine phosphatase RsbU (regulator of sigma subunit)